MCPKCARPVPRLTVQLRSLRGGFAERVSTVLAAMREFEGDEGLVFLKWPRAVCDTKDLPSYNRVQSRSVEGRPAVKMSPFDYHRPDTVDEAVALLETYGGDGKVLAGGQSLLPVLALRLTHLGHLIDIGRVQGLQSIEVDDDGTVSVGATVTHARVERSDVMAAAAPAVAGAMPYVGHRAIRSRGTVCGSLAHADPAAELPAVALAVGAEMIVQGPAGQRTMRACDFFEGYLSSALGRTSCSSGCASPHGPHARDGRCWR